MTERVGAQLELLRSLGFGELQHDSHVPFLSHLIGTRRLLASWGCRTELCDAGLFHSVYGTEHFEPEQQPTRDDVVAIIGAEAERVAWLWCSIRRTSLDPSRGTVTLRGGGDESLTPREIEDLATLWAADTAEQIKRMTPDETAFARGLLDVIDSAPPPARAAVAALDLL